MKKYLMTAMAAVALGSAFVSCTRDIAEYNAAESFQQRYEDAFIQLFGQPAANQDWGFGSFAKAAGSRVTGVATRSQSSPFVYGIEAPFDEESVTTYLATATEPNSTNVNHNNNGTHMASCQWYATGGGKLATLMTNYDNAVGQGGVTQADKDWYTANVKDMLAAVNYYQWNDNSETAYTILMKLKEYTGDYNYWNLNVNSEGGLVPDPDWVTNFKITGTWDGEISVAGSEGSTYPGAERTIVVTGTWNITENQKIGSLGKIIIANGGTVNVASGITLNMVNQARLIILEGGTLTGEGKVEVNNGNATGEENYNAGTVSVATFNNNFGQFYNYGEFRVNEYQGGAAESNFFNHGTANVDHFGIYDSSTANARIFNNCSFTVTNDARIRNYEGAANSSLVVGGQLMFSSSMDGTGDATYVGLASGALVKCGTLYNNGTSWTGPTSGYAALEITDKITYLNWEQDKPWTGGYFENNIYVKSATWDNVTDGNGYNQTDASDTYNHSLSVAEYKFFNIIANCTGGTGVTKVVDSNDVLIEASGCSPGFKGTPTDNPEPPTTPTEPETPGTPETPETPETPTEPEEPVNFVADIRIIAEDLTYSEDINGKPAKSDIDFNDVVFDVMFVEDGAWVQLIAAGGTLPLVVGGTNDTSGLGEGHEVHDYFGVSRGTMVNTNSKTGRNGVTPPKPFKVSGTSASDMGKNIPVYVQKQGSWVELKANMGEPASKLGVKPGFSYCDERQSIDDAYPKFKDWVNNPDIRWYDE